MKKKFVTLLCGALLLTALSACGGGDDAQRGGIPTDSESPSSSAPASESTPASEPAPASVSAPAPSQPATLAVTVTNVSGYNFQELYVSPSGANEWGDDHLGSTNILKNNGSFDIEVAKYDFENYDVQVIDADGDVYEFQRVPLAEACNLQIGFGDDGAPLAISVKTDGTENSVSGTLNGSSGQEMQPTGAGYDTAGAFAFEVYNNSDYDILTLHMGRLDTISDQDVDLLGSEILAANSNGTITGDVEEENWGETEWTLYVTDVDGDTSHSYDFFDPWTVTRVDISWQDGGYVCDFTY